MAHFTIKSRTFGEITFSCPNEGGYIRVTGNGWDHKQICEGGCFMGVTLMASENTLEQCARRWWKAFLAFQREIA